MKKPKIALGLYTVYKELQKDVEATLNAVSAMGYDGVEFYGELTYDPCKLREILSRTHLQICGWHTEWRHLQPQTIETTLQYHKTVGTPNIIIPALGGPWEIAHTQAEDCAEVWKRHAKEINALSATVQNAGFRLGYHFHAHEFATFYDGVTPWDILKADVSNDVILEVDTGNCLEAGADPVEVLRSVPGRIGLLHFKPYSRKDAFEVVLGKQNDDNPWSDIIKECSLGNTEWMVIEEEAESLGDMVKLSHECLSNLKSILC